MIRYRKLGYVELNVSDLERSRAFYESIVGLQYVDTGARGELRFRCSEEHHGIVLHESPVPGLKRFGLMLEDPRSYEGLVQRLRSHDHPFEEVGSAECDERGIGNAIRLVEPHTGATIEAYLERKSEPALFVPTVAKIQRIGHVVVCTPDVMPASRFFCDVLNFRVSDMVGGRAILMRPFPTPYHHGVGVVRAARRGFHHVNFMVTDIDDVGRAYNRLRELGIPIVNGMGRHPASGSVFLYYLDPDQLTVEYSFGMEQFPEEDPREPLHYPPVPESSDYWGMTRDARSGAVGENEAHPVPAALTPSH